MKRIMITCWFVVIYLSCFCQNINNKALTLFKIQLYNYENISSDRGWCDRNLDNFLEFTKNIYLNPDTLHSNIYFGGGYLFLSVDVDNKRILDNLNTSKPSLVLPIKIADEKRRYIIAISKLNGKSFKISGFTTDDLEMFWEELCALSPEKLTIKSFLRDFYIEGIDLRCLLNSMNKAYNPHKYPCTKRCADWN